MTRRCPTCGHPIEESETIDPDLMALRTACQLLDVKISWDGHVSAADAAKLTGLSPKTLSNHRGGHRPIEFRKTGRRVEYSLTELARWRAEQTKKSSC